MAISCGRTVAHTTKWGSLGIRVALFTTLGEQIVQTEETPWQPRRKPPRKRNTKRIAGCSFRISPSLSGEAPLERLFLGKVCYEALR
jgi:hypothetical protein